MAHVRRWMVDHVPLKECREKLSMVEAGLSIDEKAIMHCFALYFTRNVDDENTGAFHFPRFARLMGVKLLNNSKVDHSIKFTLF